MAAGAVVEFGSTERSLIVVARRTTLRFPGGSVKHHCGSGYLIFASSRPQRMARGTAHAFMPRMAEAADVTGRGVYRPRVPLLMTGRTRIDVRPFLGHGLRDTRFRAMALQTGRVSVLTRRDREPHPLLRRFVTSCAVRLWCVLSVVEFGVERIQAGKLFHRPRLGIGVADGTHLAALRVFEIRHMTARARCVILRSRETHPGRRPLLVLMAKKTRKGRMRLVRMGELRIIDRRIDRRRGCRGDLRLVRIYVFCGTAAAGDRINNKGKERSSGYGAFYAGHRDPGGSE